MKENILVRKYSNALFELALESKKHDLIYDELKKLYSFFKKEYNLFLYISSPIISKIAANRIIQILSNKLNLTDITTHFLSILNKNKKFILFFFIFKEYGLLLDDSKNILNFSLTTATKFTDKQIKEYQHLLAKVTDKQVNLKIKIDPNLLGGFTLSYKSLLIDSSTLTKLKEYENMAINKLEAFEFTNQ